MSEKATPEEWVSKSHAKLIEGCATRFEQQQTSWRLSAPKRELASRLLLKCTREDKELEKLLNETHLTSGHMARMPIGGPGRPDPGDSSPPPAPSTSVVLSAPFDLVWSWTSPQADYIPYAVASNNDFDGLSPAHGYLGIGMDTSHGPDVESTATAVGSWFKAPTSGDATVSATPLISYNYGNSAILWGHTHTHAWIGFLIQTWTLDGTYVNDLVNQKINLWDMTTDHEFSSQETYSLYTNAIGLDADHHYAVYVWIGGDAESTYLSYGNVHLTLPWISIRFWKST